MKDMTKGSPAKLILAFAIPILVGSLLQKTYSIADTRIVGTYLGDTSLAAVGATTVLSSLFNGFFTGIANGFAIMTAQKFGAKSEKGVRTSFAVALVLGMILAAVLVGMTLLCLNPILHFLKVPEELYEVSAGYIRIVLAGMIVTMLYDILIASARAIGDSVTPLLTLLLSVLLNIIGDIVLLGYFHTGVWGAAVATVGAQVITIVICAIYMVQKYEVFRIKREDFRSCKSGMAKAMFATGLSMGFMNSLIGIGSLILQTAVNGLGASYIVAQSVARKITEVLMSVFVSVGNTMATFCGQNYGAKKFSRIKRGIRAGYVITCSWCLLVLVIAYTSASWMVQTITGSTDPIMIEAASKYLRIDTVLYVLVAIIFVLRNSLQGIGDRITPLISSGIEMLGKVILTYTLVPMFLYDGVIWVEPIVWIVMVIPLIKRMRDWNRRIDRKIRLGHEE
ncbi:MAG: polysaccharide biosynthesis C-terminal domain-containing protein [Lachnospiraceae bacterium]|nr:polysaccharide biosynthesis C-terminal domain-containing protein [Lachnospiraceae bacterium]